MAPNWLAIVAAIGLAELNGQHPGFVRRMRRRAERDATIASLVRLGVPRPAEDVVDELQHAVEWLIALERSLERGK